WQRLAVESAKQSRRVGVMTIDPPTELPRLLEAETDIIGLFGATAEPRRTVLDVLPEAFNTSEQPDDRPRSIVLALGPEGGWTDEEQAMMRSHGLTPVQLTSTILRTETAAVVAAGVVAQLLTARGFET